MTVIKDELEIFKNIIDNQLTNNVNLLELEKDQTMLIEDCLEKKFNYTKKVDDLANELNQLVDIVDKLDPKPTIPLKFDSDHNYDHNNKSLFPIQEENSQISYSGLNSSKI